MSARPKVGFLGLGWIGQARLRALAETGLVDISALADSSAAALEAARSHAPQAQLCSDLDQLLNQRLDAVVIATPSGLHAAACERAFERGLAVFCQKPLARDALETERLLESARRCDRLLRVDLSYRYTSALSALRDLVRTGSIGKVYAAELTFHNAYGPDKAWARDPALAGGGCLVDLGVHLLDAAFQVLGAQPVAQANARLFAHGKPLPPCPEQVEDFALGQLELADQTRISLACSWQSSFGDHARIRIALYGESGGAAFENVNGSFYDFVCDRYQGAQRERLYEGAEEWGGRAIVAWAQELVQSPRYQAQPELLCLAQALDSLYGRATEAQHQSLERATANLRAAS